MPRGPHFWTDERVDDVCLWLDSWSRQHQKPFRIRLLYEYCRWRGIDLWKVAALIVLLKRDGRIRPVGTYGKLGKRHVYLVVQDYTWHDEPH